jgi:multidrug efflux pump subunit AcrA (membrane-fusion protein)
MISRRASLDIARQALEDATVRAPIGGTIVSRPVTQGQVITAATAANGGTTLMSIADLGRVRMRVTIDEVEMGNVRVGLPASVAVDAFPDRMFDGILEKIEPQAVVTQGVTFFPVMVSISNKDGLLMPGMNGEVTIKAADLKNVLQVPIDVVRPTNELAPVSRMFGITVDTLASQLRRDLVSSEGKTGIPGRYVVVALPNDTYEMRLVKFGPTDLKVAEVLEGLKEGDVVVTLGSIMASKPTTPPKLQVAENMKRGAAVSRAAVQAGKIAKP